MSEAMYKPTTIGNGNSVNYPAGTVDTVTISVESGSGTPVAKITIGGASHTVTQFPHTDKGISAKYTVYNATTEGQIDFLVTPTVDPKA